LQYMVFLDCGGIVELYKLQFAVMQMTSHYVSPLREQIRYL